MKWSHFERRIDCQTGPPASRHGWTLVELLIAAGLTGVVGLIGYTLLHAGLVLFSENVALNMSGARARSALDRMTDAVRAAEEMPQLINQSGNGVSSSTADGILVKRHIGGPYIIKKSNGTLEDIAANTKQFQVEYATGIGLRDPEVGEYLAFELTSAPELRVAAVSVKNQSGGLRTLSVTTADAIGTVAKPANYRVAAGLQRREAYIFAATSRGRELRHYPTVTPGMNFSSAANYRVIGNGYERLANSSHFTRTTHNGLNVISLTTSVHSSGATEYVDFLSGRKGFTTMPLTARLWTRKQ